SKSPDHERKVEFIDASEQFKKGDGKVRILDDEGIFKLLSENHNKLKRSASIEEVSKNGFDLSVNRYVFEDLNLSPTEQSKLVPLRKLVNLIPRKTVKP
ncbi:N-6 DNA methylase, partial [Alcanivorax sp. 1008]|uniref:N-6 DNA methylase n=1 Tax=Alcanivorax sp. 1008 TaxID=2816853 RepID=UPI001D699063